MKINSKLPKVGTNIFTIMSQLAQENNAVNLSQGAPDFDCSADLIDLVHQYMKKGRNQYAPMMGVYELREQISLKSENLYQSSYDVDSEITVTAGGSEAIFSALGAVINAGDEVILFDPSYDLYRPTIELFGGIPKTVQLMAPDFKIDWEKVRELITDKTRLILINNPNNPAGSILEKKDFEALSQIVIDSNILILSDEVYEHIVFDGKKHLSVSQFPELKKRSFITASFGKLYHITGWKVGYCMAPKELMSEFRKVHQFNTFSVNTPIQYALAEFMKRTEEYLILPEFFQKKRDFLMQGLKQTKFKAIKPQGTYFLTVDYSEVSDSNDLDFAKELTIQHKVTGVPISAFYEDAPDQKLLRFCFAKEESTMEKAIENLLKI